VILRLGAFCRASGPQPIASQSANIFAAVSACKNKTVPVGESHRDDFCALARKLLREIRFALLRA
jgi:hypothetical protein